MTVPLAQNAEHLGPLDNLVLGEGATFRGEAIGAVAKALLQSGVAYVGGYPGAPVSHLLDTFAAARQEVLEPLGVHYEQAASEAGAAALLGASIHYPLRGAVTWKSVVGTNVASDALSNLASAGVTGGALIVLGEDYGEGASVIQERSHAFALKSCLPLIDPRYDMKTIVRMVEEGFGLSEASHLPVMMELRIRACHMTGAFTCKDNKAPAALADGSTPKAAFDFDRIVLPPSIYAQEKAKFEDRLPAAARYIVERGLNERFGGNGRYGLIVQGGCYGTVMRALRRFGLADALGATEVPMLVLNVVHPLVPEQILDFAKGKSSVLVIEEGQPAYIENDIRSILQAAGSRTRVQGKDLLPMAGEYTAAVVRAGLAEYLGASAPTKAKETLARVQADAAQAIKTARAALKDPVPERPASFCAGCPERPVFTALKLIQDERGPLHISSDIGCNTFATLAPFHMGSTVLGYGMSLASAGAVSGPLGQPAIAVMGDGGFWHNGITTGAANARFNNLDAVLVILENGYASATGQQKVPSSGRTPWGASFDMSIEETLRGMGVRWIRRVSSYRVEDTRAVLEAALDARGAGLRVVISDEECMLAKKRRGNRGKRAAAAKGRPTTTARFGVDAEVCTGDHSCIRMNGCPSLTVRHSDDPLKDSPTAYVDEGCVACSLCGEAAQAARLCPSFYRGHGVRRPNGWQRFTGRVQAWLLDRVGAS